MSVIVIACVLLVSLPSLWGYYHYSKQALLDSTLHQLQTRTVKTIDNYQRFIQLANPKLQALSQLLNNELEKSEFNKSIPFDQRMMQFEDGAWRNISSTFNGQEQAGLFLPSDIKLTKKIKQFYITAMDVFDGFGASATSNQIFDNIWMLGHDRSELIFDLSYPDFVYLMSDETDYRSTPLMMLASPEINPDRTVKWTPALFDTVSESWMVSVIYPLDIKYKWQATLGIDISLDKVFSLLDTEDEHYQNEQHFVVGKEGGFILAGPWQHELEENPDLFELDAREQELAILLTQELSADVELLNPLFFQGVEHQVIASNIAPMGWRYFRLIPTDEIYQPLQDRLLKTSALILLMSALLGLLINTAVRKLMVLPLFAKSIRQLAGTCPLMAQKP